MPSVNLTTVTKGEILHFGPTKVRILEDGSTTENRISAIASTMAPHTEGPRAHIHLKHDEAFLITSGVLRFMLGDVQQDAEAGDYVVIPVGAPHTFLNASDTLVAFVTTFTPNFYIHYFRELAQLAACGLWSEQYEADVLIRYATVLA